MGSGGGGNTSTTTNPARFIRKYVTQAAQDAGRLYENGPPAYFPDSTVEGFSGAQIDALRMLEGFARRKNPTLNAAESNLTATLRGDFLDPTSNPALGRLLDVAEGRVANNVGSRFGASGRLGGGAVRGALASGVADVNANILGQNYQQERNRQLAAQGLVPSLLGAQALPGNILLEAGGLRQRQSQSELDDRMARYNYEANAERVNLSDFIRNLSGIPGSGATNIQTSAPSTGPSTGAKVAGGALSGAAAGAAIGSVVPVLGTGIGALLGALLGGGAGAV